MVISGMCERKTRQGLGSCYIFSRNLHVFLWLYYTGLKGKHLSCPAFNKFHTKEMRLLFDKEKPLGRVLLDFWGSFSGCPTGILARKVLWMWHWIREKAMVIQNARSLTNSLLNTSLTLCLADHTLKAMWKNFLLWKWYMWYKNPFFLSVVIEWSKTDKKILKWGSFNI